jgi:hypothetical protein
MSVKLCDFVGSNHQKYGGGYHITAQDFFDLNDWGIDTGEWNMTVRMFGDGNVFSHETANVCNPSRPGC